MKRPFKNVWLAGVDGCRDAWMVTFLRPYDMAIRQRVLSRFDEIVRQPEKPAIIVVDMPIGLPQFSPTKGRAAEKAIRPLLGKRRSSVFRVPSREAVYLAADKKKMPNEKRRYAKACAIARETSADKKAFSKQGFYICPKIVEVDRFLRLNKRLRRRIYESHPEFAFWRLNDEQPLKCAKKRPRGVQERRRILIRAGIPRQWTASKPPPGAKMDDVIDSFVCALVAMRVRTKQARAYPSPPLRDEYGLPMAIWA